jgi:hypothetical protein
MSTAPGNPWNEWFTVAKDSKPLKHASRVLASPAPSKFTVRLSSAIVRQTSRFAFKIVVIQGDFHIHESYRSLSTFSLILADCMAT